MNNTCMIVRLTRDADVRYSQGDKPMAIANFDVACDRDIKRAGEPTADFYKCIAFGKLAETIEKYAGTKGTQLGLEGRFQNNNWTDKDGNKHYDFQFVVNKITFCGSKSSQQSSGNENPRPMPSNGDGFMNIPDGIDEKLPFD